MRLARSLPFDSVALLDGWQVRYEGPLYSRLAAALRDAIERGEIIAGSPVAAERGLAQELGVSRTTVVNAYTELCDEGVLERRQGSGTYVSEKRPEPGLRLGEMIALDESRPASHGRSGAVDFTSSHHASLTDLVATAMIECGQVLRDQRLPTSYAPQGLLPLRRRVADHFCERGLLTNERQIIITSGAQQAIWLVASQLVSPADQVVVEDPSYLGALDAFRALGAQLVTPPTADGEKASAFTMLTRDVRLLYVMSSCNYVTGQPMARESRAAVVSNAVKAGIPVIDDDIMAGLTYGDSPPPLAAEAPEGSVITIGSMSKLFWRGLRVGWIRVREDLVAPLVRLKAISDLGTSVSAQLLSLHLIDYYEEVRRLRLDEATVALDRAESGLRARFPEWTWQRPVGGRSLWIRLPGPDASAFAQTCLQHGVAITPGKVMSAHGRHADRIRLLFVKDAESLHEGLERLSLAWAALNAVQPTSRRPYPRHPAPQH